jgi:hypothetical protein
MRTSFSSAFIRIRINTEVDARARVLFQEKGGAFLPQRLTSLDGTVFQLFERRPWHIPDSVVTAPAATVAADAPLAAELATV